MNFLTALFGATSFTPLNPELSGIIAEIIGWIYNGVKSFGITIIIFTVCLKVVTTPLDFWQKLSMKKNSLRMNKLKPLLEKIDKQFAGDSQRIAMEKQKVYKKHGASGASMFGSCLTMLLTFGIFILMFQGLQAYATYGNQVVYDKLIEKYSTSYTLERAEKLKVDEAYLDMLAERDALKVVLEDETDADEIARLNAEILTLEGEINDYSLPFSVDLECIAAAKKTVGEYYPEAVESFLWIKNLYRADTWAPFFPTYSEFLSGTIGVKGVDSDSLSEGSYNVIKDAVMEYNDGYFEGDWNGLLILPILAIALSFLSMWITQRTQNVKGAQVDKTTASTNKMMMFIMPAMMAFFAFQYTAAFALYMVCNSFLSMVVNLGLNPFIDKYVTKKFESESAGDEPSYSRNKK